MYMESPVFKPNLLLTQARLDRGWSQKSLAHRLTVSLRTVWRWERGIARPYPDHRHRLCVLFQKRAEELGFAPESPAFAQTMLPDILKEAQLRTFLENCQADPVYQREYQAYVHWSQQLNHAYPCAVSFVDWFLAAHPEQNHQRE